MYPSQSLEINPRAYHNPRVLLLFAIVFIFPVCLMTSNAVLTAVSLFVLYLVVRMTWRSYESPVLLLTMGLLWLQIAMPIYQANLLGIDIADLYTVRETGVAVWYSLVGLPILGLGILAGRGKELSDRYAEAVNTARDISVRRLWFVYLVSIPITIALFEFAWFFPRITQMILALAALRTILLFALFYCIFLNDSNKSLAVAAVCIEVVLGFSSYFSQWRQVFNILFCSYLFAYPRFRLKHASILVSVGVIVIALALFWTAVKSDYRYFLNQGSRQQEVTVSIVEGTHWVIKELAHIDEIDWSFAAEKLMNRIAYMEFFSMAINNVRSKLLNEYGIFWRAAVKNIFMPRLFFPRKELPDPSKLTTRYSGVLVATREQGSAIGIGLFTEHYIDCRFPFMLLSLFALGLIIGFCYRVLLKSGNGLFGYGATLVIFSPITAMSSTMIYTLGGLIINTIMLFFILKYVTPVVIRLLSKNVNETNHT